MRSTQAIGRPTAAPPDGQPDVTSDQQTGECAAVLAGDRAPAWPASVPAAAGTEADR